MIEYPDEIIKGIKIFAKILGAEKTIIGIETNKKDAIELLQKKLENEPDIKVYALKEKYPQANLEKWSTLGEPVFSSNQTIIYKVKN